MKSWFLAMDISVTQPRESSAKKFSVHRGSLGAYSGGAMWCVMGN
jgi:hypothetical protein